MGRLFQFPTYLIGLFSSADNTGNYTAYERARSEKETSLARTQEGIDKKRAQLEESIRKMQITASRDASGKSGGQVASRKKKLARHGAEKNAHGHRFRAQQDSYEGMSSIRAGSMNGERLTGLVFLRYHAEVN